VEETSTVKTWVIAYIGGSGERLRYPLINGTEEVFSDVPILVTDYEDYRRLMSNPNKYKDVTPVTTSTPQVTEEVTKEKNAEPPAEKVKGGKN
jgi:hypothetical protein